MWLSALDLQILQEGSDRAILKKLARLSTVDRLHSVALQVVVPRAEDLRQFSEILRQIVQLLRQFGLTYGFPRGRASRIARV